VSTILFTLILVLFVAAAVAMVRRALKPAIAERLPLEEGERVLLDESGLKVFHQIRYRGVQPERYRDVLSGRGDL
jgi:hypothetical protein